MSDPSAVQERIARLFRATLKLEIPSVDTDLFETGVLDSLAFVELLLHLEEEFGVTVSIEDLEIEQFRSVERIAEFVMARNGGKPGPAGRPERD